MSPMSQPALAPPAVLPQRPSTLAGAWAFLARHRKAIVLTFEIFWILVFLLEAVQSESGQEIAGFVYVNF